MELSCFLKEIKVPQCKLFVSFGKEKCHFQQCEGFAPWVSCGSVAAHHGITMNLVELAQRIRNARLKRGLTLEEVSESSGLAKGLLSKVENFRVTPTLTSLAKLTETLGIKLSELLDGLDDKPRISVVRRSERKPIERNFSPSESGSKLNNYYESLAHRRPDRVMDPLEIRVPANGGRVQAMKHEGEEFLLVLEGSVTFEYDKDMYRLEVGDSLYFDAETDHRVFNETDKDARVLCVMCMDPSAMGTGQHLPK
ncbi:MAG: helix-turn-helix domain-containing protein [Verrucomicrobium sp.]